MRRIIIDTDCGVDDAIAIMIALTYEDDVQINGITTVTGNTYVDQVTKNVLRILDFFGKKDIKVYKGASKPLINKLQRGAKIHGEDGLGDIELKYSERKEEEDINAISAIYKISKENGPIDIITLGPLTNISIALNLYPELKNYINVIYSMGGAIEIGNVTKFAEFNFHADPEAVQTILDSKIPFKIVPWDGIVKNSFLENELKEVINENTPTGKLFHSLTKKPLSYVERLLMIRAMSLPDPIAIACYLDESIIKQKRKGDLMMELNNNALRGSSILLEGESVEIVLDIYKEKFLSILNRINNLKGGEI
ncbi:MAG: nucleoside hydrolase [Caldisericia bacterium]